MGGKISKHVSLKHKLDLARYMHPSSSSAGELTYRLVSLISHIGPSSSCGHYTAIAASSNGIFFLFDDSMVRQVSLQTVLTTNAYVIVYELEPPSANRVVKPAPAFTAKSTVNGLNGKPIQNGVSQSPLSMHKQALVLSSSKAERTSALNASSATSSVPTLPLIASCCSSSSSQLSGSPKPCSKMPNGVSSPSKSLVPYNESSDSESENTAGYRTNKQLTLNSSNGPKEAKASSTANGVPKEVVQKYPSLFQTYNNRSSTSKEASSPPALKLNVSPSTSSSPKTTVSKNDKSTVSSLSANRSPTLKKMNINEPLTLFMNGWHVSDSSLHSPNGSAGSSSGASSSSLGQWNVTDINKSRLNEKEENNSVESKVNVPSPPVLNSPSARSVNGASVNGNGIPCSRNNGTSNNSSSTSNMSSNSGSSCSNGSNSVSIKSNGNPSPRDWNGSVVKDENSSKLWEGGRSNDTVGELLKLSHRGYGTSNVNTWSGEKSEVEKEIENEKRKEQRKRSLQNSYDEEFDRGKVKKVKSYSYVAKHDANNGRRYNAFQDHQNRKHSWHAANGRHMPYRSYNIDRHRNNHRFYHNQNGFRSWRH